MSKKELIESKRELLLQVAKEHGALSLQLFGSVARGEDDEASDVDFLVKLEKGRSLFDLGGLQMALQSVLDCSVDVVTVNGLRERIRQSILDEAIAI